MTRCRTAAIAYVDRGWVPVPMNWTLENGRCSCNRGADCGSPGKHPRVRWANWSSTSLPDVMRWYRWWPKAGVGILTGALSNLLVVDVDPRHGGDDTLAELERLHSPLPPTLSVITGGGGSHLYFAHPGFHVGPSAGQLGPGLDVRGDGGLVAAPPTVHASGNRYRWVDWRVEPVALPEWLAEMLRTPVQVAGVPMPKIQPGTAYARAALAAELERVRIAPESQRNDTLFLAAANIGEFVAAHALHASEAAQALLSAGVAVGLTERESRDTILSAFKKTSDRPRRLPA